MTTRERIENDLVAAVKGREASVVSTLRMLRSALKNAEIDKRGELDDDEVVAMVGKEVKKLEDSIKDFEKGDRRDLVDSARAEVETLKKYLPEPLSDEELRAIVEAKAAELGEVSPSDFGRVMKAVMAEAKGRADGGRVSALVKEKLS
ncbi:GatB/YqeY domain-containing protein [Patescibacteria group bacterium]